MKRPTTTLVRALAISGALLGGAACLAVFTGSVDVSAVAAWRGDRIARAIFALRLPRVAVAALTGAGLGAAGAALQALLRNPLADPFLLGTSGGAAAGAAIAALAGAPLGTPFAAFAGAAAATFGVVLLSMRSGRIDLARLLLAGITANAFFSALILLILSVASGGASRSMLFWMMGSLAGADASQIPSLAFYTAVGLAGLLYLAPKLNLFLVGEDDAAALGVSTEATKAAVFIASALLAGAATAFVGIIGFVGLVVPHIARLLWGNDQRVVLPVSAILGAALLVAADALSRRLLSPAEIPIGALTAVVGVPFFVALLRRST
jgi:iron complex transport system permease protein